jgi:hypothetical protein
MTERRRSCTAQLPAELANKFVEHGEVETWSSAF